jgi:hypothetical protein
MITKTLEDLTRAKSTLAEAEKTRDAWNNIVLERKKNLAQVQEAYEKGEQARNEDLMLRYLAHLGWEKSAYRTSSTRPARTGKPVRKLRVATASEDMMPDGTVLSTAGTGAYFTQTGLVYGCGAHTVLMVAAKEWEATR